MALNIARFWDDSVPTPGVTDADIRQWESESGVALPAFLCAVLKQRNGGLVRNSSFQIAPLKSIVTPDDDFWEWVSYDEEAIPEQRLVFSFAMDHELGGMYLLNFNANGPDGKPSVYQYYSDPGDLDFTAISLTTFFEGSLATEDRPCVNWDETQLHEVIAEETIDLSSMYGGPAALEQVFCRNGRLYFLYTRTRFSGGENMSKARFMAPLNPRIAMISPTLANTAFSLHLAPTETETMVYETAEKNADGQWKNSEQYGVPVYVTFISRSKDTLEELRVRMLSERAVREVSEQETVQSEMQQVLLAMDLNQKKQFGMEMLKQMQAKTAPLIDAALPAEGDQAFRSVQQKMQTLFAEAAAQGPLSDELQNLIQRYVQAMTPDAVQKDNNTSE